MNNPIKVEIPAEVAKAIEAHLKQHPGSAWLGKLSRETFTGQNFATSGRLFLELGAVPDSALPKLRDVVAEARAERQKIPRGSSRA